MPARFGTALAEISFGAAEIAKKFLNHPNRRIREWANLEISYRLQLAEREDREHEERFLPS